MLTILVIGFGKKGAKFKDRMQLLLVCFIIDLVLAIPHLIHLKK